MILFGAGQPDHAAPHLRVPFHRIFGHANLNAVPQPLRAVLQAHHIDLTQFLADTEAAFMAMVRTGEEGGAL